MLILSSATLLKIFISSNRFLLESLWFFIYNIIYCAFKKVSLLEGANTCQFLLCIVSVYAYNKRHIDQRLEEGFQGGDNIGLRRWA